MTTDQEEGGKLRPQSQILIRQLRWVHDMLPDGRFVGLVGSTDTEASDALSTGQMRVVLNWFTELQQRVPTR